MRAVQSSRSCTDVRLLEGLFHDCFYRSHHTQVIGGADEPFYQPARDGRAAQIHYRQDFLRSLLHEVAHWCLATGGRRKLPDYGYWYQSDDRDPTAQLAFYAVEARPQALEQLFCDALGLPFSASIDNPGGDIEPLVEARFSARIAAHRDQLLARGLPARAALFLDGLRSVAQP